MRATPTHRGSTATRITRARLIEAAAKRYPCDRYVLDTSFAEKSAYVRVCVNIRTTMEMSLSSARAGNNANVS